MMDTFQRCRKTGNPFFGMDAQVETIVSRACVKAVTSFQDRSQRVAWWLSKGPHSRTAHDPLNQDARNATGFDLPCTVVRCIWTSKQSHRVVANSWLNEANTTSQRRMRESALDCKSTDESLATQSNFHWYGKNPVSGADCHISAPTEFSCQLFGLRHRM